MKRAEGREESRLWDRSSRDSDHSPAHTDKEAVENKLLFTCDCAQYIVVYVNLSSATVLQ